MSTYALRARWYHPGGAAGGILPHLSIDLTAPIGTVTTATVKVARAVTGPLPEVIELAVEHYTGSRWEELPNARLISTRDTWDELDPAGIVSMQCVNVVTWLLSKTALHSVSGDARRWTDSAGLIIRSLVDEATARGWGQGFGYDFTALADSAGASWSLEDLDMQYEPGQTTWAILQSMADQFAVEYATHERTLSLFHPNTGTDRSAGTGAVRVGISAKALPVTRSIENIATHQVVRGEADSWTFAAQSPGLTSYGRLEAVLSGNGVTDSTTAGILAAPGIALNSAPVYSFTITEDAASAESLPGIHYSLGDWVSVRRAHGFERMRVVQIQLRDAATLTIDLGLNTVAQENEARLARRSAALGGALGGNGTLGGGRGGSSASTTYATIAPNPELGALTKVLFDGSLEPSAVGYKRLRGYNPAAGDRVLMLTGGDGELVIVGDLVDFYWTRPGNFEYIPPEGTWTMVEEEAYGAASATITTTNWVALSGRFQQPADTPETPEIPEAPDNDGAPAGPDVKLPDADAPVEETPATSGDPLHIVTLQGVYRPQVPKTVLTAGSVVRIDTDGTVWLVDAPSRVDGTTVVDLSGVRYNVGTDLVSTEAGVVYGCDAYGLTFLIGKAPDAFAVQVRPEHAPDRERTVAAAAHLEYRSEKNVHLPFSLGTDGFFFVGDGTTTESAEVLVDGTRWQSAADSLTWVTLDLLNGFEHRSDEPLQLALREDGFVLARGGTTGGLAGTAAAVIPEGMRPSFTTTVGYGATVGSNGNLRGDRQGMAFYYDLWIATH